MDLAFNELSVSIQIPTKYEVQIDHCVATEICEDEAFSEGVREAESQARFLAHTSVRENYASGVIYSTSLDQNGALSLLRQNEIRCAGKPPLGPQTSRQRRAH